MANIPDCNWLSISDLTVVGSATICRMADLHACVRWGTGRFPPWVVGPSRRLFGGIRKDCDCGGLH